jgi:septal ring factor EnvC (AmiA/AmiB activator)
LAYNLTNAFIKIDPISVMRGMIDKFKEEFSKLGKNISELNGVLRDTKEYHARRSSEAATALRTVEAARRLGDQKLMALNSREHGRADAAAKKLEGIITTMTWMLSMLRKAQDALDFQIKDMEAEVRDEEQNSRAMKKAFSAMLSARKLLAQSDERDMFNRAMEISIRDRNEKLGQIEDFMSTSRDFMASFDLQNMVYSEEALAKLQDWERKADDIMFSAAINPKTVANNPTPAIDWSNPRSIQAPESVPVRLIK